MISYIHLLVMVPCFFTLLFMWRWWTCIHRLGLTNEVGRRAPSLIKGDILAASFAAMSFPVAVIDWFEITLPHQSAPTPSGMCVLISIGCFIGCMTALANSSGRLAGSWAGTRESALRTVAALRIIDAAEIATTLDALQHGRSFNRNTGGLRK